MNSYTLTPQEVEKKKYIHSHIFIAEFLGNKLNCKWNLNMFNINPKNTHKIMSHYNDKLYVDDR